MASSSSRSSSSSSSSFSLAASLKNLVHVQGTFDTFRCTDCGSTFSGYLRGDPHLHEHVLVGEGRCAIVQSRFWNDVLEILKALGRARFQRGLLAHPHNPAQLTENGYDAKPSSAVPPLCHVCNASIRDPWHYMAWSHMKGKLLRFLIEQRLLDPIASPRSSPRPLSLNSHSVETASERGAWLSRRLSRFAPLPPPPPPP